MKRALRIIGTLAAIWVSLFSISCKYDLISEPTVIDNGKKSPADYADYILPPTNATASQGTYRAINLEWDTVENAVQYQIYAATTPFDNFEQVAETAGAETNITIDYPAGTTMYFAVAAVNYYGSVSSKGNVFSGSTLAVPIITNITPSADSQSVDISWWMDNCDETTYINRTKFIITAYDSKKKLIAGSRTVAEKSAREVEIHGLQPKTDYFFMVEAILLDSDGNNVNQKSEKSDYTSAATTHSVVPKSVNNFSVSQGISTEYITLSWDIPDGADSFDSLSNTYKIQPVAFHVQRKLMGSGENTYETIDKICIANTAATTYSHYSVPTLTYDCSGTGAGSTTAHSELTVSPYSGSPLELYPNYIPGSTFIYTDKNAVRGKQYTYRVVTFTDDTIKQITAKSSISNEKNGWKLGNAHFKANAKYEKDDISNQFTKITASFAFDFEDFGLSSNYKYIITETKTPFEGVQDPEVIYQDKTFTSQNAIASEKHDYDLSQEGYYKYKLYITPLSTSGIPTQPSDYYLCLESAGAITVTTDSSKLPSITNLNIEDGYSDKFIIKWDNYDSKNGYILTWIPYINGQAVDSQEQSYEIPQSEIIVSGTSASFIHTGANIVKSGDVRSYSLTADCGIKVTETAKDADGQAKQCKTLGTAVPVISDIDYKAITVTWDAVQMAETYEIHASYDNDNTELVTVAPTITDNGNGTHTCIINEINGYQDPSKSGLPINLKVVAKNAKDVTGTTGNTIARTLGPALTNPRTNATPTKNALEFKWDAVEGASKYLIYRTLYKDKTETAIASSDIFVVEGTTVTTYSGQDVKNRTTVKFDSGTFTLTDRQQDAVDNYGYHINQAKIQWGLPYGYTVLPLKADGTKDTFKFKDNSLEMESSSTVNYGTLTDVKTSTRGYGMNVTAKKAVSASEMEISWVAPNNKNLVPTVYRKRFNTENNYDNKWELVKQLSEGITKHTYKLPNSEISNAYVYAVQYDVENEVSDFVKSYRDDLVKTKDTENSPTEPKNKGYLLALENFSAVYGGTNTTPTDSSYYQENVSWKNYWDYDERALGPDSFKIEIKNKNLSSTANWTTVADISINNNVQTITAKTDCADTTISVSGSNNGITLKPTAMTGVNPTANSTDGVLKVLRDTKHYYSAYLTRGAISTRQAEDESIYAYRQISDEELIKISMLLLTDGFYRVGKLDFNSEYYPNVALTDKYNGLHFDGSISFVHKDQTNKQYTYAFTDYSPYINTPTGNQVQSYIIDCSGLCYRTLGTQGGYPVKFDSTTISVKPKDTELSESKFGSYYGTVTFNIDDYTKGNISCNKTTISITSENMRRKYFPLKMCTHQDIFSSTNEDWYFESTEYGWWN